MRKLVVSEGLSLDGVFEARTMGVWVTPFQSDERNAAVRDIFLAADALLMGRNTYKEYAWYYPNLKKNEYGIADRMNSIAKFVVTSSPLQPPWNNSTAIGGNFLDAVERMKAQPGQDILVQGSGTLVQALAQAGLVDTYQIMVHPAIAGSGRRFFKDGASATMLTLVETRPLPKGVILLTYEVAK